MLCVCVGDVMDVVFSVCIVRRGAVGASWFPRVREKSWNLTWVPSGPGKVRLFINTSTNPGKVRDFKVS